MVYVINVWSPLPALPGTDPTPVCGIVVLDRAVAGVEGNNALLLRERDGVWAVTCRGDRVGVDGGSL